MKDSSNNFPTKHILNRHLQKVFQGAFIICVGSRFGDNTRLAEERMDCVGQSDTLSLHHLQGGTHGHWMAVIPKAVTLLTNGWQSLESLEVTKLKKTL